MQKSLKIIYSIVAIVVVALATGWIMTWLKLTETTQERDEARLSEGLCLLHRAEISERHFPDTLLYAAKAIGYAGQGIEVEENPEVIQYINPGQTEQFGRAEKWLNTHLGFVPVWSQVFGESISDLAVSPHGRYLITAGIDSTKVWDFSHTGSDLEFKGGRSAAFHPDGKKFAILDENSVVIWEGDKEIARYKEKVSTLAYNLSGDRFAGAREDGTIVLLGEKTEILGKAQGKISQLAFGPDDATLAAVVENVGLRLWFHHDKAVHQSWAHKSDDVTAVTYHPGAAAGLLATGSSNGSVSIYRIFDGKKIAENDPFDRHKGPVTSLSFQPDGKRIVSGGADGFLHLWNIESNIPKLAGILSGHQAKVHDVAFFPDGQMVASCSANGTAKLWNVRSGVESDNLYNYIKYGWYIFGKETQSVAWGKGSGFLNLPSGTLVGAWQGGKETDWASRFIENGNVIAASLLAGKSDQIQISLGASVDSAVESGNWNLARLRSRQMDLLGLGKKVIKAPVKVGKGFTNGEGSKLIWCKPGKFSMGEEDGPDFAKSHEVTISQGFWLGKNEVTRELYETVMGVNPSANTKSGPKIPVENVSWFDAQDFCLKLTGLERARGGIPPGWRYAIPTEAQWEYACRAGTKTTWSFGDDKSKISQYANFDDKQGGFSDETDKSQDDGYKFAAPVESYKPNPWKFNDMQGNVFEWCRDSLDSTDPNYPEGPATDPMLTKGNLRVIRGGGFDGTAAESRSAYRDANQPLIPGENLGFRFALVRLP